MNFSFQIDCNRFHKAAYRCLIKFFDCKQTLQQFALVILIFNGRNFRKFFFKFTIYCLLNLFYGSIFAYVSVFSSLRGKFSDSSMISDKCTQKRVPLQNGTLLLFNYSTFFCLKPTPTYQSFLYTAIPFRLCSLALCNLSIIVFFSSGISLLERYASSSA